MNWRNGLKGCYKENRLKQHQKCEGKGLENTIFEKEQPGCRPPLIILTGPTAVGKTDLSIRLAKAAGGEIISADSMQVYRRMDIGTAKIRPEKMQGVPHHLIDILEPSESFNAFLFQRLAKEAVQDILSRGRIPIITGGTGFYIQTVLFDIDFTDNDGENSIRSGLEALYKERGAEYLHDMLKEIDAAYAKEVHANNVKKVIRAIEFYRQTGTRLSEHNAVQRRKKSPYNFAYFVLNDERSVLYDRIERRIDKMLEDGLVGEVQALLSEGLDRSLVSMQGLGYKEIAAYLAGEITLDEAVYILKRDTRHFAKRQLTWFRREKDAVFVDLAKLKSREAAFEYMMDFIRERRLL